jgi:hypothetical protein
MPVAQTKESILPMADSQIHIPESFPPLHEFPVWSPLALKKAIHAYSGALAGEQSLSKSFEHFGITDAQIASLSYCASGKDRAENTYAILCDVFACLCTNPSMEKVWDRLKARFKNMGKSQAEFDASVFLIGTVVAESLFSVPAWNELTRADAAEKAIQICSQINELSSTLKNFGIGINFSDLVTDQELTALSRFITKHDHEALTLSKMEKMLLPGPSMSCLLDRLAEKLAAEMPSGSTSTRNLKLRFFVKGVAACFSDLFELPLCDNVAAIASVFFPNDVLSGEQVRKIIQ